MTTLTTNRPYLYVRGLRQVDHTVFCVQDGQKTYYDPLFGIKVPYSSGQQVKRSLLDLAASLLNEGRAPITFNYNVNKDGVIGQGEPWSPCDPRFADQLLGGWMKAQPGEQAIKRRSPLSVSAMRPLHPTLAGVARESVTFDRSGSEGEHRVRVIDDRGNELSKEAVTALLLEKNRTLPARIWIPEDKVGERASGLFVYDIALDLRLLFSVSLDTFEPEVTAATLSDLRASGWEESTDGARLVCPRPRRDEIIPALAHSLIHWHITSNQSRTFSLQNTLAIAISDNANRIGAAIRAELRDDGEERPKADPALEEVAGVSLYTALPARAYIRGVAAAVDALEQAEADLVQRLSAFDYEITPPPVQRAALA